MESPIVVVTRTEEIVSLPVDTRRVRVAGLRMLTKEFNFDRLLWRCGQLEELQVIAHERSPAVVSDLASLWGTLATTGRLSKVTKLVVARYHFRASGLGVLLAKSTPIRTLELDDCEIIEFDTLAVGLAANEALTTLTVSRCGVTAVSALAIALTVNRTLRSLSLSCNMIEDVSALGRCLALNETLQELDLSWNRIAVAALFDAHTAATASLQVLDLSHNLLTSAADLVMLLAASRLAVLRVGNNRIANVDMLGSLAYTRVIF
jgi:hypothetical protein